MYTNANFWRDMAILAGAWIVAGWSYMHMSENVYHGCAPSGALCE